MRPLVIVAGILGVGSIVAYSFHHAGVENTRPVVTDEVSSTDLRPPENLARRAIRLATDKALKYNPGEERRKIDTLKRERSLAMMGKQLDDLWGEERRERLEYLRRLQATKAKVFGQKLDHLKAIASKTADDLVKIKDLQAYLDAGSRADQGWKNELESFDPTFNAPRLGTSQAPLAPPPEVELASLLVPTANDLTEVLASFGLSAATSGAEPSFVGDYVKGLASRIGDERIQQDRTHIFYRDLRVHLIRVQNAEGLDPATSADFIAEAEGTFLAGLGLSHREF